MKIQIKEMTPRLWEDLEQLFGEKGACRRVSGQTHETRKQEYSWSIRFYGHDSAL